MKKTLAVLPQLLQESALIWHSTELSANKKEMLRLVSLQYWYIELIIQFKERMSHTLHVLQVKKYRITNAQEEKSPRIYTQSLFCYVKVA